MRASIPHRQEREAYGWYPRVTTLPQATRSIMKHFLHSLIVIVVVTLLGIFMLSTPRPSSATNGIPVFSHVFQIVMENHEYSSVIGNSSAPYTNSLAQQYGLATNYYGIRHPSLPNYLAMIGGDTFGITSDCTTCFVNATNLVDRLEGAGKSWKAYMESMPSPCFVGDSGQYVQRHNPFIYFDDIRTNTARCNKIVPFTQFTTDIQNNSLPNYAWITPNLCNDTHDCGVSTGDTWLKTWVPKILASPAWQQNGVLFITYDEGSSSAGCCTYATGGHIVTLVISPLGKAAYQSTVAYDHYSLLHTVENAWGLSELGKTTCACSPPMSDFFGGSAPTPTRTGTATNTPTIRPTSTPTPSGTTPVFSNGFESGNLAAWTSSSGLIVQSVTVHTGSFAAQGNTTNGATYAKKTLPASYSGGYGRVYINLLSFTSQVNLLRFRTAADGSIAYLYVDTAGKLNLRNDAGAATFTSTTPVGSGWHALELHAVINSATSTTEVWLDGVKINALSVTTNLGTTAIGRFQIGEVQSGRTYNVIFDDAVFDIRRIGV
jgi:hypothetical protein